MNAAESLANEVDSHGASHPAWLGRPAVWVAALVVFGLFLRLERYFSNASLWHDEAWLVLNLLEKDYGELLGKLDFDQAAPPLFLWAERAMVESAGDSTYSLRLLPLLASCAALLLLARVAGQTLRPWGCLVAVLLCACSERMIWHTSDVKPYAIDVCLAALYVALFQALQRFPVGRQLAVWIVVTPLTLTVSYPAFFLCGGLLVALLPEVWRSRTLAVVLPYGVLAATIVGVIGLLLTGPIAAQSTGNLHHVWRNANAFPNWNQPGTVPFWLVWATVKVCDHACRPAGGCLLAFAIVGVVALWRQGRKPLVAMLLVPVALAAIASLLGRYPYTGSRLTLYALPAVCLLVGVGLPVVWDWLKSRRPRLAPLLLAPLAATLLLAGYRLASPCQRADCSGAAAFIQAQRHDGDAVVGDDPSLHYYFRHDRAGYHRMELAPPLAGQRVWVAATHVAPPEWSRFVETTARDGWRVAERTDFLRTEVLLMVRDPDLQQARTVEPDGPRLR